VIKSLHQTSSIMLHAKYLKTVTVFETLWPECIELFRPFCEFVWLKAMRSPLRRTVVLVGLLSFHDMPHILSAHINVDKICSQAYGIPILASAQLLNNSPIC